MPDSTDPVEIALLSDVHSEADALAAVAQAITEAGIERAWCLGDTIDWLLPRRPALRGDTTALRRAREICELVLLGNHESELLADEAGRAAVAAGPGGAELLAYLDALAPEARQGEILLVHGSPTGTLWSAVETAGDARAAFAASDARLIVCGHTHLPFLASCDAGGNVEDLRLPRPGEEQLLTPDRRWLVNPGAVGRAPLDGIASWAVLRLGEHGEPVSVRWQLTGFGQPATRLFS